MQRSRFCLVLFFLLVMWPVRGAGQTVRVVHSIISGSVLPFWIAQDEGLFRKHRLAVEMIAIPGPARSVQAFLAGEAQMLVVGGQAVVLAALKGADVQIFASVVDVVPQTILTARDIIRPEQLRGKRIGISTFGSAAEFWVVYGLRKYGLDAYKDVAMIQLGDDPTRFAALASGAVQAVVLTPPTSLKAKRLGYHPLIDLSAMGLKYPQVVLAASSSYMKTHEDVIRRFLRTYVEAVHRFRVNRQVSLNALKKYMRIDDPETAMDTIQAYQGFIPPKPHPTVEGMRFLIEGLSPKNPGLKDKRPEEFLDMKFVQELDQSGFIDALYKGGK